MTAWIGVASADHVARGRTDGFMQVCHGKSGPLSRIRPGDEIIYYSPSTEMGGGDRVQSFTAAGRVTDRDAYRFDMGRSIRTDAARCRMAGDPDDTDSVAA